MPSKGTHIKALFLLVVFSLNTVVSFACSLGGLFHSAHHHKASTQTQGHHQHGDAHHGHGSPSHNHEKETKNAPADDCCSKNVVQLDKVEKAASRVIEAPDTGFLALFLISFSSLFSQLPAEGEADYPGYIRRRLPPTIPDLRIVIQSFQI